MANAWIQEVELPTDLLCNSGQAMLVTISNGLLRHDIPVALRGGTEDLYLIKQKWHWREANAIFV